LPFDTAGTLVNTSPWCGDVTEGSPVGVAVDFTDPGFDNPAGGTREDFTDSTIDWGDGNVETWPEIDVDETPGGEDLPTTGNVAGSHVYEDGGIYTVSITVRDDDGGPGNDHLNAGNTASVMLGGAGDDHISGGSGNDILVGGGGLDRLVGGPGQDILLGDYLMPFESDPDAGRMMNEQALLEMLDEWDSDDDFEDRQEALGAWLNQNTVFDDDDEDILTGASDDDWFFLFDDDIVTDSGSQSGKGGKNK
jgi:hypothetical protein